MVFDGHPSGHESPCWCVAKEIFGRAYVFLNKSTKAMPYLNRHWTGERKWFLNAIGNRYSILTSQRALSRNWVDTFHKGIDETGRVISEARKGRKDWRRMQEKEVKPNCIIYYTGLVSTFLYQNTTNILKSYKQTFSYLHLLSRPSSRIQYGVDHSAYMST